MFNTLLILSFSLFLFSQNPSDPNASGSLEALSRINPENLKTDENKKGVSLIQQYLAPFEYDRERFRDPFESQGAAAPLSQGQVYGPFLQMQKSKLSDYRLKGLLWKTTKPMAIFSDKDGKEVRLGIKDYIGENFGYIASIREKEVVIIQTIEEDEKRYSTTKVIFLEN